MKTIYDEVPASPKASCPCWQDPDQLRRSPERVFSCNSFSPIEPTISDSTDRPGRPVSMGQRRHPMIGSRCSLPEMPCRHASPCRKMYKRCTTHRLHPDATTKAPSNESPVRPQRAHGARPASPAHDDSTISTGQLECRPTFSRPLRALRGIRPLRGSLVDQRRAASAAKNAELHLAHRCVCRPGARARHRPRTTTEQRGSSSVRAEGSEII